MPIMAIIQVGLQIVGGVMGHISKSHQKKIADYMQEMEALNVDSVKYIKWLSSKYKTYRTYKKVIHSHFRRLKSGDTTNEMYLNLKPGGLKYILPPNVPDQTYVKDFKGNIESIKNFAPSAPNTNPAPPPNPVVISEIVWILIGTFALWFAKVKKAKR